jgi:hypothetical protein
MKRNKAAEEIASHLFRAKERRRRALAKLPMEKKVEIVSRMQKIAKEIRTIARASKKV